MNESEKTEREWAQTEYAIIGCAINNRPMVAMLTGFLPQDEAFQVKPCRAIFRAMKEIGLKKGSPEDISPVTVTQTIVEMGLLDHFREGEKEGSEAEVFTAYFDAEAFDPAIAPDALEAACAGLTRRWATTKFARVCIEYGREARKPGANAELLVPQIEGELKLLWEQTGSVEKRVTTLEQAVYARLDVLDDAFRTQKPAMGLPTGFEAIDTPTGGLHPATLTLLGGWYKDGKTSLAGRIGLIAALSHNKPVLMFSYEMSPEQMADRFFAQWFGASLIDLRTGKLQKVADVSYLQWSRSVREKSPNIGSGRLENMRNFFICQSAGMTVQEQEATLRNINYRLQQEGREPVALVIVDYIQLVQPSRTRRDERRHEEVSQIGWELAQLAKRTRVPVLALSQLSQEGHTSESKGLMGHCDSFWTIRKQLAGKAVGMFHMVLNRNAPSNLGRYVQWDGTRLCYNFLAAISDPDGELAEQKRAVSGKENGRKEWLSREQNGDRGGVPGREDFAEVSRHRNIFPEEGQ